MRISADQSADIRNSGLGSQYTSYGIETFRKCNQFYFSKIRNAVFD